MYIGLEQFIADYAREVKGVSDREALERVIEGISRAIDAFTRRPESYFAVAGELPSPRLFVGEGQTYLRLPVHVEGSIDAQTGVTVGGHPVTNWIALRGWLYMTKGFGCLGGTWCRGAEYTVRAQWGYSKTPSNIQLACALWAQAVWQRGRGVIGEVSPNGFVIERDMPPTVKTLLMGYRKKEFEIV